MGKPGASELAFTPVDCNTGWKPAVTTFYERTLEFYVFALHDEDMDGCDSGSEENKNKMRSAREERAEVQWQPSIHGGAFNISAACLSLDDSLRQLKRHLVQ